MPADVHGKVGHPLAGAHHCRSPAPQGQGLRRDAGQAAHPGDEIRQGAPGRPGRRGLRHLLPQVFHEVAASQDPFVAHLRFAAPAEGGHSGPAPQAAPEATPL